MVSLTHSGGCSARPELTLVIVNILLVNWQDRANPHAGGAEIHLFEIFGRLAAAGHRLRLICSGWTGAPRMTKIDGIDIERVGGRDSFAVWGAGRCGESWPSSYGNPKNQQAARSTAGTGCCSAPSFAPVRRYAFEEAHAVAATVWAAAPAPGITVGPDSTR